jgi:uncharacterized protein (TIGR03435 family)
VPMRMLLAFAATCALNAQTTPPRPSFEVVSIKPLEHFEPTQGRPPNDPGRVTYWSTVLWGLIMQAYDVKKYQLSTPAWMDNQYYDISAKLPDGASRDQVPTMLQTMLADRFGLKVHWEPQTQSVYALLVAKDGPKLKKFDPAAPLPSGRRPGASLRFSTNGHFEFYGTTMDRFAQVLSNNVGRPVLNITNLDGQFDISLDLNPAEIEGFRAFREAGTIIEDNSNSASVFAALGALGLKLESRKAPIQHLIIDSVFKTPTEN